MADGEETRTPKITAQTALGRHGLQVGPMAYGAAGMGNLLRTVPDEESSGAVAAAWECGMRYFDVAPHYGLGLAWSGWVWTGSTSRLCTTLTISTGRH